MSYQYRLTIIQTDGKTDLQEQYTNTIYPTAQEAQSQAEAILDINKNIYFQVQEEYIDDTITS